MRRRLKPSELVKYSDNLAGALVKYMAQPPKDSLKEFEALEKALFAYHSARTEEHEVDE